MAKDTKWLVVVNGKGVYQENPLGIGLSGGSQTRRNDDCGNLCPKPEAVRPAAAEAAAADWGQGLRQRSAAATSAETRNRIDLAAQC